MQKKLSPQHLLEPVEPKEDVGYVQRCAVGASCGLHKTDSRCFLMPPPLAEGEVFFLSRSSRALAAESICAH